ncbi:hypothetical protein EJ04DRAFT_363758 [Polyplosphaeria fusca]|uniref:Uncharacterized protein n=1 Tax=Polyplosphaeria fusca TaxID=682080 RepID=A0A9P4QUN4_9PLEO|nr:hypothetical protein EJ04DRAFT_363758 [Polyplosphaeria fusca]
MKHLRLSKTRSCTRPMIPHSRSTSSLFQAQARFDNGYATLRAVTSRPRVQRNAVSDISPLIIESDTHRIRHSPPTPTDVFPTRPTRSTPGIYKGLIRKVRDELHVQSRSGQVYALLYSRRPRLLKIGPSRNVQTRIKAIERDWSEELGMIHLTM